jgi:HK97 family phage prohead protease
MEKKALPTEFKVSGDGRTVEGYASTFGNVDYVGDMVCAGAYKKTLAENFGRLKVLRDHDQAQPIGKPEEAYEDSRGLYTKSRISDTQLGNETLTLLRDGVLDRMSIGYSPIIKEHGKHEGKDVRFLKEIKLFEWSIVTFPANDAAAVTGIKALEDLDRAFHEFKAGRLSPQQLADLLTKAAPEAAPLADHEGASLPADHQPDTTDSTAVIADIRALIGDIRTSIRRAA